MMRRPLFGTFSIAATLCAIFAVAVQIQITLFQTPDYLGLRINLADLVAPFAGIAILYTLLRKQSLWPDWKLPRLYFWLAGLTAILCLALVNTHFTYGEISRWALINKFCGWFILLALLVAGGWIGTNAKQKHLELFIKTFLYFGLSVVTFDALAMVGQSHLNTFINTPIYLVSFPIDGFMANRNAYALLFLALFALSMSFYFTESTILKHWYYKAFMFITPFFLVFNASRAMSITIAIFFMFTVALNIKKKAKDIGTLVLFFLAGIILLGATYHNKKDELLVLRGDQLSFMGHLDTNSGFDKYDPTKIEYPGDSMRLTILTDAKEMIIKHPVSGSGLGSMLLYQKEKHGQMINLIDCTPLWLLVETGAIGVLAFAAFFIQAARTMYTQSKKDEGFIRSFRIGILAAMACYASMSLFHEIMYTRFVWILLGIALTMDARRHQNGYTA